MTTTTILIIVAVIVVLVLLALVALMMNKKKAEQKRLHAEHLRSQAAGQAPAVSESQRRAEEAEARALLARTEAERAEERAAEARQGMHVDQARLEDTVREADRIDPGVNHRSDTYIPTTPTTSGPTTGGPATSSPTTGGSTTDGSTTGTPVTGTPAGGQRHAGNHAGTPAGSSTDADPAYDAGQAPTEGTRDGAHRADGPTTGSA